MQHVQLASVAILMAAAGAAQIKSALVQKLDEVSGSENPEFILARATRPTDLWRIHIGQSNLDALIPEGISIDDAVGSDSVAALETGRATGSE